MFGVGEDVPSDGESNALDVGKGVAASLPPPPTGEKVFKTVSVVELENEFWVGRGVSAEDSDSVGLGVNRLTTLIDGSEVTNGDGAGDSREDDDNISVDEGAAVSMSTSDDGMGDPTEADGAEVSVGAGAVGVVEAS